MLKIDLLPRTDRRTSSAPIGQWQRLPIVWVGAGVILMLALAPLLLVQVQKRKVAQLNARLKLLQPKRAAIDQVQQMLSRLREQESAFSRLSREGDRWSKRLNTLSDVTPDGVWFEELVLDRTKGLVIRGSAIGEGGAEMMRVGRLVQDLKADPGFSAAVKDIQIESIKRMQEREVEVVKFTLACALAGDQAVVEDSSSRPRGGTRRKPAAGK